MSYAARPNSSVLEREYEGTPRTLRAARTDVVGYLTARGIDPDLQEKAELVVSELATNAVQAAPGSPFGLRLSLTGDGSVVMAVTSQSQNAGPPPHEAWRPPSVLALTGRGLMIVSKLASRVEVDQPADGTVVVTAVLT